MTELDSYIREHAAQFDTREPAVGHRERFLARLDAMETITPGGKAVIPGLTQNLRALFSRRPAAWTLALAAFAAALLFLLPGDRFRAAGNDPAAIYCAYMDRVARLYDTLPPEESAAWDSALAELTEEPVPLFVQLPDELPDREKSRILKAYYGELLDGARQLRNKQ